MTLLFQLQQELGLLALCTFLASLAMWKISYIVATKLNGEVAEPQKQKRFSRSLHVFFPALYFCETANKKYCL